MSDELLLRSIESQLEGHIRWQEMALRLPAPEVRILREIGLDHHDRIRPELDRCESPIERLMFLWLIFSALIRIPAPSLGSAFERISIGHVPIRRGLAEAVKIEAQFEAEGYRADFAASFSTVEPVYEKTNVIGTGEVVGIVLVECDGHEFHDRTKEQASRDRARDRALVRAGYRVARFTGSDIWHRGLSCANEVWEDAEQEALRSYPVATIPYPEIEG